MPKTPTQPIVNKQKWYTPKAQPAVKLIKQATYTPIAQKTTVQKWEEETAKLQSELNRVNLELNRERK